MRYLGLFMEGRLQKIVDAAALACRTCTHFRDDHLEYFYCFLQKIEFPALCDAYMQSGQWADARTEWIVPDEL